jgi:hypothetical protein
MSGAGPSGNERVGIADALIAVVAACSWTRDDDLPYDSDFEFTIAVHQLVSEGGLELPKGAHI